MFFCSYRIGKITASPQLDNAKGEALAVGALCVLLTIAICSCHLSKNQGASLETSIVEKVLTTQQHALETRLPFEASKQ